MKQWIVSASSKEPFEPGIDWLIQAETDGKAVSIGIKKAEEDPRYNSHVITVRQYALDTEGKEDKEAIVYRLYEALRMTREFMNLRYLEYIPERGTVMATFSDGYKEEINVECDSGIAMIKGIIRGLTS